MDAFARGRVLFTQVWVPTTPGASGGFEGLGPVFNETSCLGCHVGNGRASAPEGQDRPSRGMLVRLSLPGRSDQGGPVPLPAYGDQFNDHAIHGVPAEGKVTVSYSEEAVTLGDGTRLSLRKPDLQFTDLAFGPFPSGAMTSERVAQPLAGMGLLEAIPEDAILANARAQAAQGGPVHGHPNIVWDPAIAGPALGRYGWKANQATLASQTASAAYGDMGLTSSDYPDKNCTAVQTDCAAALRGPQPDLSAARMSDFVTYLAALAVPERRNTQAAEVRRGEALFGTLGCAACHKPDWTTGAEAPLPILAGRTIHPYTDMLLHDMGPGLADGRPDFRASGSDWRTPPLWGLGLVKTVNPAAGYLHDGRARTPTEAILWHGGEATAARNFFANLPASDREALLAFLGSL
jgi:CxxC motif-containing protein (DUF1111 family)